MIIVREYLFFLTNVVGAREEKFYSTLVFLAGEWEDSLRIWN